MATPRVIRNALEKPESEPFVAPSGRFVFVPLAPNVGCGWAKVEKDRASGRLVASLSVDGRRLGYRTLEDVCDSPAAAERLRAFLKRSECRRGARLPEERLPSAVAEMRKRAKSGRPAADEAFDWGEPPAPTRSRRAS